MSSVAINPHQALPEVGGKERTKGPVIRLPLFTPDATPEPELGPAPSGVQATPLGEALCDSGPSQQFKATLDELCGDFEQVLGLEYWAELGDVVLAFYQKAVENHPRKGGNGTTFANIISAAEALRVPRKYITEVTQWDGVDKSKLSWGYETDGLGDMDMDFDPEKPGDGHKYYYEQAAEHLIKLRDDPGDAAAESAIAQLNKEIDLYNERNPGQGNYEGKFEIPLRAIRVQFSRMKAAEESLSLQPGNNAASAILINALKSLSDIFEEANRPKGWETAMGIEQVTVEPSHTSGPPPRPQPQAAQAGQFARRDATSDERSDSSAPPPTPQPQAARAGNFARRNAPPERSDTSAPPNIRQPITGARRRTKARANPSRGGNESDGENGLFCSNNATPTESRPLVFARRGGETGRSETKPRRNPGRSGLPPSPPPSARDIPPQGGPRGDTSTRSDPLVRAGVGGGTNSSRAPPEYTLEWECPKGFIAKLSDGTYEIIPQKDLSHPEKEDFRKMNPDSCNPCAKDMIYPKDLVKRYRGIEVITNDRSMFCYIRILFNPAEEDITGALVFYWFCRSGAINMFGERRIYTDAWQYCEKRGESRIWLTKMTERRERYQLNSVSREDLNYDDPGQEAPEKGSSNTPATPRITRATSRNTRATSRNTRATSRNTPEASDEVLYLGSKYREKPPIKIYYERPPAAEDGYGKSLTREDYYVDGMTPEQAYNLYKGHYKRKPNIYGPRVGTRSDNKNFTLGSGGDVTTTTNGEYMDLMGAFQVLIEECKLMREENMSLRQQYGI
ncbi:hypothetical protein GP486_000436 [Trichoglossum hirsutum]|uniref:Uncharacterized protein n=1 Tax=Trichoglossum hirsutum TaxID=265104 RepID=A0A9P8LIY0_9PEZI|nr:hypothetical protein GP486_000436 [Trichoglossum hirsutum]